MGNKSSKKKKAQVEAASVTVNEENDDGNGEHKLKKKSNIKRKLTKAFVKPTKQKRSATHAGGPVPPSLQRSNTIGTVSVRKASRPEPVNFDSKPSERTSVTVAAEPGLPSAEEKPPTPEEKKSPVRRATSAGSFIRHSQEDISSRPVALPKRLSRAYIFHQQIATKNISERGDELQRIMESEKPICDIYEDNPFRKGFCRLCKHPKTAHADPYADILNDLEEF